MVVVKLNDFYEMNIKMFLYLLITIADVFVVFILAVAGSSS